jgi:hypothetical protein
MSWNYTVKTPIKVMPEKEWVLLRETDGSLRMLTRNYLKGRVSNLNSYKIDRGDHFRFLVADSLNSNKKVEKGDTIGYLHSRRFDRTIQQIKRSLRVARQELEMMAAGSKPSLIRQARQQLEVLNERERLVEELLQRNEKLFEKNLISIQQLDSLETRLNIIRHRKQAARENLNALRNGAKKEHIEMLKARVE